ALLSSANFFLLCFNLLPAYPLDGGLTLDAWLGALLGATWSVRIVACLGLARAIAVALYALTTGVFLLFVAFFLAQANWEALQSVGGWSRRRESAPQATPARNPGTWRVEGSGRSE